MEKPVIYNDFFGLLSNSKDTRLGSFNQYNFAIDGINVNKGVNAGNIDIKANNLKLLNNTQITSQTFDAGKAGDIVINTPSLLIDNSSISTNSENTQLVNAGDAGRIDVTANRLTLVNHGQISSNTQGSGNAGDIFINANDLFISLSAHISSDNQIGQGGDIKLNTQQLSLIDGGFISTTTYGSGNAGKISIQNTNDLLIRGVDDEVTTTLSDTLSFKGRYSGFYLNTYGEGNGGTLQLNTKNLNLEDGAVIAAVAVDVDSVPKNTALTKAGDININVERINLQDGGVIAATTASAAKAGSVTINASDTINISGQFDRMAHPNVTMPHGTDYSAILSNASRSLNPFAATLGEAGSVDVNANANANANTILLTDGELINVSTEGDNKAGTIHVNAQNDLYIDNGSSIISSTFGLGNAGIIAVNSKNALLDNGSISSETFSAGHAGDVLVKGEHLLIKNNGEISTSSNQHATGHAGTITVDNTDTVLDAGFINSNTEGSGNAGNVLIKAKDAVIANNHASISSSTSGAGSAGNINIIAPLIALNQSAISAEANAQSQGQTGNINVAVTQGLFLNQSAISLKNDANVVNPINLQPSAITVVAPDIILKNSKITTEATGNVDAGDINVYFTDELNMDPSFITTTANQGNGGSINIHGGKLITLQDSGFITSVSGANSHGGDINLNLKAIIPSYNRLILGGDKVDWQPFVPGLNVIQAASETGVNGVINVTSPQFDISANISGLDSALLINPTMNTDVCQNSELPASSLKRQGQGGLPIDEAQYGFIPPTIKNNSASAMSEVLARSNQLGDAYPCANLQP